MQTSPRSRRSDALALLAGASIVAFAAAVGLWVWDRIPAGAEWLAATMLDGIDGAWR